MEYNETTFYEEYKSSILSFWHTIKEIIFVLLIVSILTLAASFAVWILVNIFFSIIVAICNINSDSNTIQLTRTILLIMFTIIPSIPIVTTILVILIYLLLIIIIPIIYLVDRALWLIKYLFIY
jgi:hypothetical protein